MWPGIVAVVESTWNGGFRDEEVTNKYHDNNEWIQRVVQRQKDQVAQHGRKHQNIISDQPYELSSSKKSFIDKNRKERRRQELDKLLLVTMQQNVVYHDKELEQRNRQ
jgi:hypothetical protein